MEFDWDSLGDPPLSDVHRAYLEAFDRWLRAPDEQRPVLRSPLSNLLDLMRLDTEGNR